MKIDPTDFSLYTDDGRFLKILDCPLKKSWQELKPVEFGKRMCDSCSCHVHDTAMMSDQELVDLLIKEPDACLKVSSDQPNCTVVRGVRKHQ